jgi:crossover junction endodeoxyribonuclease RusA
VSGLRVVVNGKPAPQGSKRHVGNGRMIEMSKAVGPWREAVRGETQAAITATRWLSPPGWPVLIDVVFYLPRPAAHYGTGRNGGVVKHSAPGYPAGRPDVDKLARAVLDGLTMGGALADDAQVVELQARKRWADGHPAGAVINLEPM